MVSRHLLIFIYLCEKQGGHLILHSSSDLNISNSTNFSFTYGELEGEWKEKCFPYSDVIFFVAGWKWKFWHYGSKSNHFPGTREHMFTDVWATHVKEQIIHLIILSIKKKKTNNHFKLENMLERHGMYFYSLEILTSIRV